MSTRRDFLTQSLMGGMAFVGGVKGAAAVGAPAADGGPIVVSTWDFGKQANAGAWEVLKRGGRA